jgi:hypothetical protein
MAGLSPRSNRLIVPTTPTTVTHGSMPTSSVEQRQNRLPIAFWPGHSRSAAT